MAFYKQDIVDINLNTGSIFRSFLNHSIGFKNDDADRFGIRCFRDGEPVDLSGASCQAVFMAPNGVNIALTSYGTVSGNVAYVTLPPACYDYEGQFCLSIQLVGGGVTGTMRIVDGMVVNTGASGAVAPTASVPTYQEIIAQYDAMVAATSAANLAIAETFDATNAYPAGKYVINDGHLYRLTADHAANVTWANTSKVATNFGDDLTALKSALNTEISNRQNAVSNEAITRENADNALEGSKIPFPVSPDSKYGTNGQNLRTLGNGKTQWVDQGLPTDEQTARAVSAWLDDHPEATTTVQDGSITLPKLHSTLKDQVVSYEYGEEYGIQQFMEAQFHVALPVTNYLQGCTVYGGYAYICDEDTAIRKIDLSTGEAVWTYDDNTLGHMNACCVLDNKLFVLTKESDTGKVMVFDISTSTPSYIETLDSPYNIKLSISSYRNMLVFIDSDLVYATYSPGKLTVVEMMPFTNMFNYGSGYQQGFIYKGFLYFVYLSSKNSVTIGIYNLTTLDVVRTMVIKTIHEHDEIEAVFIDEDYVYCFFMNEATTPQAFITMNEAPHYIKVRSDEFSWRGLRANRLGNQNSIIEYYVSTTGSDTNGKGSSTSPFRTIQRAIKMCEMYCNYDQKYQIMVTGGDYSSDTEIMISSKSKVEIHFYNSPKMGKISFFDCGNISIYGDFKVTGTLLFSDCANVYIAGSVICESSTLNRIVYCKMTHLYVNKVISNGATSALGIYSDVGSFVTVNDIQGDLNSALYGVSSLTILPNNSSGKAAYAINGGQVFTTSN